MIRASLQPKSSPPDRASRPSPLVAYAAAAGGVVAVSALLYFVPGARRLANTSPLYLLVVLGTALRFGRRAAVLASVLAFLATDWFFVRPHYTFTVGDPSEWLALVIFLITAMVTGQLTALLQAHAVEARQREREAAALAEASLAVASSIDRDRALAEVLRRLSDVIEPEDAAILGSDGEGAPVLARMEGASDPPTLSTVVSGLGSGVSLALTHTPAHPHTLLLPLAADERTLGALYLRLAPGREVTPQERRVVESLSRHAAVILERDRLAQVETQARALAEADRLKTALLSMVSHDFRSPLASIRVSATALLEEGAPLDAETQRELLAGIDEEAERLNRMVGNILALSRLDADAWRPRREPTDPAELVGAALQTLTAAQSARVCVSLEPDLPEAILDPVQIVQVIHNLLDNALKYSPAEEPVGLDLSRRGDRLLIEVTDRGDGLPAGDDTRIFDRFYRAPGRAESAIPGVGIGLAVCKGLVEAHGGRLTASSREGGGAVFRCELPLGEDRRKEASGS